MGERASAAVIGPGTVLNATYRIERMLGEGGMGVVWEASHLRVPKRVAIKVLLAADGEMLARFRQEAEVASRLGHPNIVDILDFDVADGTTYMVMELLHGESLAQRLESGALPTERAIAIARQIASALQAAHDAGVIHRDLKPANVFLVPRELDGEPTDEVKVLDFGISKVHGSQVVRTHEGAVVGTPQYMAPEQAAARHDELDAHTDQFALGAICYEMLSGRPAFEGENATQVMFKIVYESPAALDTLVPALPQPVVGAITRALSTQPRDRFDSVSHFVEALSGRPLDAPATARMNQHTLPVARRGVNVATADTAVERPHAPTEQQQTSSERPRPQASAGVDERAPERTAGARAGTAWSRMRVAAGVLAIGVLAIGVVAIVVVAFVRSRGTQPQDVRDSELGELGPKPPPGGAPLDVAVRVAGTADAAELDAPAHDIATSTDTPHVDAGVDAGAIARAKLDIGPREPKEVAAELDIAETEIAKGIATADLEMLSAATARINRTQRQKNVPRANVLLAVIGCARHDIAEAHGKMRGVDPSQWPAIRARCAKLGFPITDP